MRAPHPQACEGSPQARIGSSPSDALEPSSTGSCLRLVVVEDGTIDAHEHPLPSGSDETVFVAQAGGERPMEFAQRVIRRIAAFEQRHRSIVSTTVLLSPRFDSEATASRLALAHELMTHSRAALGTSELLLSAGSELHPSVRAKVVALADLLMADPSRNTLLVSVHFTSSGDPRVRLILGGSAAARRHAEDRHVEDRHVEDRRAQEQSSR